MNGDDITSSNDSMPYYPKDMPLWQRVMCLLGYHKRETRKSAKGHCFGVKTEEGERKGIFGLHDEKPMNLRDQCGRCNTLLGYLKVKKVKTYSDWEAVKSIGVCLFYWGVIPGVTFYIFSAWFLTL